MTELQVRIKIILKLSVDDKNVMIVVNLSLLIFQYERPDKEL